MVYYIDKEHPFLALCPDCGNDDWGSWTRLADETEYGQDEVVWGCTNCGFEQREIQRK